MRKAVRIGVLVAVIGVSGAAALYDARGDQREVTGLSAAADPARARSLDCSGFVRMVYGYRSGYPLLATNGHRRVLSSRKFANGPTFGDAGGVSLIDGSGTYAKAFRAAKRL